MHTAQNREDDPREDSSWRPWEEPAVQQAGRPIPGMTADDVTARLNLLFDRRAAAEEAQGATRRAQIDAYIGVNPTPPTCPPDPTGWIPPYAWDPASTNSIPAIFTHPRWSHGPTHPQAEMDPPIVQELISDLGGTFLQQPRPAESSHWRNTVNDIHRHGVSRTGNQDSTA